MLNVLKVNKLFSLWIFIYLFVSDARKENRQFSKSYYFDNKEQSAWTLKIARTTVLETLWQFRDNIKSDW